MDHRRGAACVCWGIGKIGEARCGLLWSIRLFGYQPDAFAAHAGSDGALWRPWRLLEVVFQIEFHHVDVTAHMLRCGAGETTFIIGKLNLLELKVQGGA